MATSVDITPSIGHSPLYTQLGIGSVQGYDAIDLRRLSQVGIKDGVHDANGWKVTEHTPNSMDVDVAANVGPATVWGQSVAFQSKYLVPPHSGTISVTIPTAHATLPRLDQIILQVYDEAHDASGLDKASVEVLEGTATAGADINNRNGAASLPATSIRLADIETRAGVTSITNLRIRDRRPWANGAFGLQAPGVTADWSTLSTSFVPIDTSTLQMRIECSGAPVRLKLTGSFMAAPAAAVVIAIAMDGVYAINGSVLNNAGTVWIPFSVESITTPAAGSHLFTPGWFVTAGAGYLSRHAVSGFGSPPTFTVEEIVGKAMTNNGTS